MTQEEYDNLVSASLSKEAAERLMRERGLALNGVPMETELAALNPSQPAVGQADMAVNPPTPRGGNALNTGLSVFGPEDKYGFAVDDLLNKRTQAAYDKQYAQTQWIADLYQQQRDAQEAQARALYNRMYPTDPNSPEYKAAQREKMFNIAAQFLKPNYGGFRESLGNVAGYLGAQAGERRQAQADLNKRLMELSQAYDIAGLKGRVELAQEAMKPKNVWSSSTYDPERGMRMVPPGSDPSALMPTQEFIELPNKQRYVRWNDGLYRPMGASADTPDAYVAEGDVNQGGTLRKWTGGM